MICTLTNKQEEAKVIPLYLEGGALATFMEMNKADRLDAGKIKARLREAYSDSLFVAFDKLVLHCWTEEESVDVYANELRRLAVLAGFNDDACEKLLKLTFV